MEAGTRRAASGTPLAALVAAAALWGLSTSGTKFALGGFGPLTLLAVELGVATLALWAVVLVRGRRPAGSWWLAVALGVLEPALAYVADTVGLARTSAANASVIAGLECTFVVVLAVLFLRERVSRSLGLAVLIGLAGLLALEQVSWLTGPGLGDLCVLCGALSAAAYTIVARRIDEDCDALTLTARQFGVATLGVVPAAVLAWLGGTEAVPVHVAPRYWLAAAFVGIVGYAVSFLIYNWAIAVVPAATAAVIINLIPAFGLLGAVVWLGDRLTPERLLGAALITASVAIFTWTEVREARVEPVPARTAGRWPGSDVVQQFGGCVRRAGRRV